MSRSRTRAAAKHSGLAAFVVGSVVAGSALVAGVVHSPSPAAAQSCDTVVIEGDQVDEGTILRTITELSPEAEWVVRVYDDSVPSGELEDELLTVIEQCFADGPQDRQADVVVLGLSIDGRETRVIWGTLWNEEVGPIADATVGTDGPMADSFRDGDFTEGMVVGLETFDSEIEASDGAALSDDEPVAAGDSETGESETGAATGSGGSSDGVAPGILLGGLVGAAAIGGGGVAVSRRRRLTALRNSLESRSGGPIVDVGVNRERATLLMQQSELWEKVLAGRTLDEVRQRRHEVRAGSLDLDRSVSLFREAVPEGVGNADREELAAGGARLDELIATLEQHGDVLDRLTTLGDTIDRLRVSLPVKVDELDDELPEALALAAEREAAGWRVDEPEARLRSASQRLADLDLEAFTLDLLHLSDEIEAVEADLFAARHDLQTLPDRLAGLREWAARLEEAEAAERARTATTEERFASVTARHAPESWEWAGDHASHARSRLERAEHFRVNAMDDTLARQEWEAVGAGLETSGLEQMAADELLDQLDVLLLDLESARSRGADIVAEAAGELDELARFVDAKRTDLGPEFRSAVGEGRGAIDGLTRELERRRPNHLLVAQTATRLAHRLDALLFEAEEEHAQVVALRREVRRQIQRAERAIERAESALGWEFFASKDSRSLDALTDRLRQIDHALDAQRRDELEHRVTRAEDIADDAVAIRTRIINRRRRNNTWVVVGGSGGRRGRGGGGGFGGFGGGFGGGGGGGFSGGGGSFGGFGGGGGGFGGGSAGGSW